MNQDNFMKTAHLLLGLTRQELERRIRSGQVDPLILKSQIEQSSHELKLESRCENMIELNSLDQADKLADFE